MKKIKPKLVTPLFPKKKDDPFSEEFYEDVDDDMPHPCDKAIPRRTAKLLPVRPRNGRRNSPGGGVLLLSHYKPKEFGNASIMLTVDGGQHLRSPGDGPPKITQKNLESIFADPIFDHKP